MKSNVKFFAGLALGLAVSFLFLNVSTSQSENAIEPNTTEINSTFAQEDDPVKGEWVSSQTADQLIGAFKTDFIQANGLPDNTTIGGVIGRKHLRDITGSSSDDLIKFRFYFKKGDDGSSNVGVVFYPKATSTTVLKTGASSFCPSMCDY